MQAISRRISHIVFASNLLIILITVIFYQQSMEEIESVILDLDKNHEIEYFDKYGQQASSYDTKSPKQYKSFRVNGDSKALPKVFKGLKPPASKETKLQGKEWHVFAYQSKKGTLYVAKSIQVYESKEAQLERYALIALIIMLTASILFALIAARLISNPISALIQSLNDMNMRNPKSRITTKYQDIELKNISESINKLLDKSEEQLKRERMLISMASHELKTPVAIILGAIEVIDSRALLADKDKKTLKRITTSANDMKENINALLKLAKESQNISLQDKVNISNIIRNLVDGIEYENQNFKTRIFLNLPQEDVFVFGDKSFIRMLFQNLINNSLNHTQANVKITLNSNYLEIIDNSTKAYIPKEIDLKLPHDPSTGIGLYIVQLICEALEWHYKIIRDAKTRDYLRVYFGKK